MPNHVRNRLVIKATGQELKEVLEYLKGEPFNDGSEQFIDFNNITPMPEALNVESGSIGDIGMEYIIAKSKRYDFGGKHTSAKQRFNELGENLQKQALELGKRYLLNIVYFGYTTWYDWSCENWGTKWNAYSQHMENGNEIWFDTAWSRVIGLIEKISQKFPEIEFEYTWADEDTGNNCGKADFLNRECEMFIPDNGSIEAYEIAFEMRPEYKEYYELIDGEYKYKEED